MKQPDWLRPGGRAVFGNRIWNVERVDGDRAHLVHGSVTARVLFDELGEVTPEIEERVARLLDEQLLDRPDSTSRFVRMYRWDVRSRLRIDSDPADRADSVLVVDEDVHPEQLENPDARVTSGTTIELDPEEAVWLHAQLGELIRLRGWA